MVAFTRSGLSRQHQSKLTTSRIEALQASKTMTVLIPGEQRQAVLLDGASLEDADIFK